MRTQEAYWRWVWSREIASVSLWEIIGMWCVELLTEVRSNLIAPMLSYNGRARLSVQF